ncbi:hypothetical protein D3C73_1097680 [compost metagenome]
MTYLSCKEIYELMTELGYTQTNTRKYAHEFELKNGQYIYIKRLKDSFSIFEILRRISLL